MTEFLTIFNKHLDSIILLGGFFGFLFLMVYWHADKNTHFDIRDLLIDSKTKELSLYKVGQLVALIISTWVLVHETRAGRLSEYLYAGYMIAWSGTNLIKKYLEKSEPK